ncbi:DNA-3-methyladenine glycosylase I [Halosquirtibacter laminarini]|uniref:DNA-3-methyladenine glycosylase I n=1 Tax=Halosquirtibacter laminarini TaxID=3374600 RepID=A0AC61NM45_9BACT|nr:DNA-3-methyladenine glycosylase I [Prolixibacteraceae bacterium]
MMNQDIRRCEWCKADAQYIVYHDTEWGVPKIDDIELFEKLSLEGAQAGLSWITILRKREGYREAFMHFVPQKIVEKELSFFLENMDNPKIVRNRRKIESIYTNAIAFIEIQKEYGTFANYWWKWSNYTILDNQPKESKDIPSQTELSKEISKDLKKRGFKFVGPTIIYSMMQATGMINDHLHDCMFRNHGIVMDRSLLID